MRPFFARHITPISAFLSLSTNYIPISYPSITRSLSQSCCNSKTGKQNSVSEYYSKTVQSTSDLVTSTCFTDTQPDLRIQSCISNIHPDVLDKYYGCGLCIPESLEGLTILDLGCGAGRDVYIASQLVGPTGRVIGVDMTQEQLDTAKSSQSYNEDKVGYNNVEFLQGTLENLDQIKELKDGSVDVIISNCVFNLCENKEKVFEHCYRLLKPGGEIYFSDIYSDRRVPSNLQENNMLWGECLSGALYWNDFLNMVKKVGFRDVRIMDKNNVGITNPRVKEYLNKNQFANLGFQSVTVRLFKVEDLELGQEEYGQAVIYRGGLVGKETEFILDKGSVFETGRVKRVSGNTWLLLRNSRFKDYFEFIGDSSVHYGEFRG